MRNKTLGNFVCGFQLGQTRNLDPMPNMVKMSYGLSSSCNNAKDNLSISAKRIHQVQTNHNEKNLYSASCHCLFLQNLSNFVYKQSFALNKFQLKLFSVFSHFSSDLWFPVSWSNLNNWCYMYLTFNKLS